VPRRQPEPGRGAIVEHIDRKAIEPDYLREPINDSRDVVECVGERAAVRHVGLAEPGKIRRDDVETVREPRDELAKHMSGARKAMQQQQRLRVGRPRFAIENIEALDIGLPKADFVHNGPRFNGPLTPLTAVISGKSASKMAGPSSHLRKSALGMRRDHT
jgi:hypothetical protein